MDLEEDNLLILDSIIKDDEEYINKFVDNSVINEIKFSEVKASTNENISSPKITTIDLSKEENLDDIKNFVKALNDIIIQKDEFHLIEKVLLHPSFQPILNEFRESEVLIDACKKENIKAIQWLITMNLNFSIQDKNGMTALMYAAENPELLFLVKYIIFNHEDCVNITDNNDENALFHAINNDDSFSVILDDSDVDFNHINKNKDTVLILCCKKDLMNQVRTLAITSEVNTNIIDREGRTGPMYLVKNGRYHEFQLLTGCDIDLDYKNEKNETLLSILIQCIYKPDEKLEKDYIIPYIKIVLILVQMNCDFNIAIDEEGNTPLMFFIMIEDICTVHYILTYCSNLDVSIKNKKGESAFSLSLKLQNRSLIEVLMNHPSFDFSFFDSNNNNLLMLYSIVNDTEIIEKILAKNIGLLNHVNNKNENALIIATKLRNKDVVNILLDYDDININQQDYLGNTAIHYAVQMKCKFIIKALIFSHADINLKNKEGKSALDLASELKDNNNKILDLLSRPIPDTFKKKSRSKSKLFTLKTIKKIGSKRMNSMDSNISYSSTSSSGSINSQSSSSTNINSDKYIKYKKINESNKIIDFCINEEENKYKPLKDIVTINEDRIESYGHESIMKPETGVTRTILTQAITLEIILVLLNTDRKSVV